MNRTPRLNGAARTGLYLFAFTLAFWPLADLVTNAWPPQFGNVQWRYGFAGLLSAFLHTPMIGLLLALGVAWASEHRVALKALGWLQLAAAAVMAVVMVMFALDLLQVRGMRPPEALPAMLTGGAIAEAKYLTALVALAFLGLGTLRLAKAMPRPAKAGERPPSDMVMKPRSEASQ